jgi:hypothetical protein
LAFRGNQSSLQYGWNMEDIQEQMRYATGRDRRQLMKQQERSTISYAMNMGQLDTEKDRLDERKQWAEEDHNRQKTYFEERVQWTQAEMDLSLRHHEEDMGLSQRKLATEQDYFRAVNQLQDQRTATERKFYEIMQREALNMITHANTFANDVNAVRAAMTLATISSQILVSNFEADFANPNGRMLKALEAFVSAGEARILNAASVLGGSLVGQPSGSYDPSEDPTRGY